MDKANAMPRAAESPAGKLRVWVLDVQGLLWAWSIFIGGFIVSTIVCRMLLDPYDISKTWPFELWYGLHVALAVMCLTLLWRGTRHIDSRPRQFCVMAIHTTLGFVTWIILVIATFWSGFLPFIK